MLSIFWPQNVEEILIIRGGKEGGGGGRRVKTRVNYGAKQSDNYTNGEEGGEKIERRGERGENRKERWMRSSLFMKEIWPNWMRSDLSG
jgi:hypothetical protein